MTYDEEISGGVIIYHAGRIGSAGTGADAPGGRIAEASMADKSRNLAALAPWLALLAISLLINYVDRGNVSIAAPLLKDELHLNPWQLGILFSAFFWTYTALQFVMGWFVDRFEVNVVIAVGYLVWSLATVTTGFVHGFMMLLVMRLMLGIGESVAVPACSKILAHHVPEYYRGFANGIVIAGVKCGPAVGTLGAGLLMAKYGWRPVFIVIGLVSLAWLPAWWKWMPRGKAEAGPAVTGAALIAAILRQRSFWGASAGHFCTNYLLYVMITWLPFYLVRERHLSIEAMAKTAGLYFLVEAAAAISCGWLSDSFIRRRYTPTLVRKSAMALGHTIAGIAIAACVVAGPHTYLAWLMAAAVGSGMISSGVYAFSQTLAGPQAAGTWTGFQSGFANLAGVVAPALTGFLVNRTGNFLAALAVTASVSMVGSLAWVLAVGRLEQVTWAPKRGGLPTCDAQKTPSVLNSTVS
ncbi:MAG TPA: MFS transporter [Terriglobales bacterium]|nr:MFS transporter [Terriglobales bacterium]